MANEETAGSRLARIWNRLPLESVTHDPRYIWFVVGTVCIGAFMAALDASIVNVALPTMQDYFHVTQADASWVLIAYLLTLASLVTAFGRIADMVGRRVLYTFGFLVFIIGSAACGAAVSLPMLIASRVFQAAGAGMLQANSVAIITATVPAHTRGKAIGFQGSAQAIGLSIGPAVGGALIALIGWRAIFYVNVPVGIIGTTLGALLLPRDHGTAERQPFDWVAFLLFTPFLVSIMLAFSEGPDWGWGSAAILGCFAAAVVLGVAFWAHERGYRFPMVDLSLFRVPTITVGNLTGLLSYSAMFGTLYLMPYFLKRAVGMPESEVGLLLTPVPLAMTVLAPMAGGLADRYGSRLLTTGGMALTGAGCLLLALSIGPTAAIPVLIVELGLVGAGLGLFTPPNNSSVMGASPREKLGVSGGILNMARSLGMSWGTAFSGSVMVSFLVASSATSSHATPDQWTFAIRWAFIGLAVLSAAATGLSAVRAASHDGGAAGEHPHVELA
jgi:EmrB/QacA subfamily drug resistance transporter